jgi:hypothetical protein
MPSAQAHHDETTLSAPRTAERTGRRERAKSESTEGKSGGGDSDGQPKAEQAIDSAEHTVVLVDDASVFRSEARDLVWRRLGLHIRNAEAT